MQLCFTPNKSTENLIPYEYSFETFSWKLKIVVTSDQLLRESNEMITKIKIQNKIK